MGIIRDKLLLSKDVEIEEKNKEIEKYKQIIDVSGIKIMNCIITGCEHYTVIRVGDFCGYNVCGICNKFTCENHLTGILCMNCFPPFIKSLH